MPVGIRRLPEGDSDRDAYLDTEGRFSEISVSYLMKEPGRNAIPKVRPGVSAAFRTAEKA